MTAKDQQKPKRRLSYAGFGLSIGLVFGGLIGTLIGNPIIFSGGVMVLGFAIGTALDNRRN
jgi:uncharacterized membrane protein